MSETNRMIHTPEGVRDIYTGECGRRLAVQERILKVLYSYGYEQIQTPSFEFMETFRQDRGSATPGRCSNFLTGTTIPWF